MSEAAEVTVNEAASAAPPEVVIDDSPDAIFAAVAAEMGHSPKEKWKGDPEKWKDAKTFILDTPKALKAVKAQLETTTRAAAAAMERIRAEAIADAEARIAEAAESGDREAARAATDDLKRATAKPDPMVEDFGRRNPWMITDEAAKSVAIATAQKVADSGGSVAEQLAAAEKEVRRRFPEHFDTVEDEPSGRQPPAVHGGQRIAAAAPRKKGWNDLPTAVRGAMTPKMLKMFDQTQDEYASAWFKENS